MYNTNMNHLLFLSWVSQPSNASRKSLFASLLSDCKDNRKCDHEHDYWHSEKHITIHTRLGRLLLKKCQDWNPGKST